MARDILSEFGPERSTGSRGSDQARDMKDVMNYKPPQGPTNITESKSPGLHGDNCGNEGSQGGYAKHKQSSGSPGLGGETDCCVQGKH